ncbi:MAG TPA: SNF2-related protein [Propionibacteriaceae bacterium]|nr:SNF2-related protein [Propionibacteriaceae bacterium]
MDVPDWVAALTDDRLRRDFGDVTFERGLDYANGAMVGSARVEGPGLVGTVTGTGSRLYRVRVNEGAGFVGGSCTCPMMQNCKHVVAVILAVRNQGAPKQRGWQRAFAGVVSEAQHRGGGTSLGIQVSHGWYGPELRLKTRTSGGKWAARDLSWELGSAESGVDPTQAAAVRIVGRELGGDGYGLRGRALSNTSPGFWVALRAALDAGVELLGGDRVDSVQLSDTDAVVSCRYQQQPDGALLVTTSVQLPGVPDDAGTLLVGTPPHGVALGGADLVLAPLERSLTTGQEQFLRTSRQVLVPADDVPLFTATVHPLLLKAYRVQLPPGLELPLPQKPRLRLDVTWRVADQAADLAWSFRYEVGRDDIAVAPHPATNDPVVRDVREEQRLIAVLGRTGWPLEDDGGPRQTETVTDAAVIRLAPRLVAARTAGIEVVEHGSSPDLREADEPPLVQFSVRDSDRPDWFDLEVTVTVDGVTIPFADLFRALAAGDEVMILDDGTWFPLDTEALAELRALIAEAIALSGGDVDQLHLRPEQAGLWEDLVATGVVREQSATWHRAVSGLLDPTSVTVDPVPEGLTATLRSYQTAGFEWLAYLWRSHLGGVLADDMGLGKTVQALALLLSLKERGELTRPALVIAPTSVLGTWAAEAERFAPGLVVRRVEQTSTRREALAELVDGADVVVTSYTLLRLDAEEFHALDWSLVLLDEAQFVKNRASKTYHAVRRLRARTKLAMTGTPLENNLMDLWSLLSLTAPGLFTDPKVFDDLYRRPVESGDADRLGRLRRRIRPLMLRRTKDAVARELPPKQETVVPVPLASDHRRLYDRELQAQRRKVLGLVGDMNRNRVAVLAALTRLRRLALSPALVDEGPAMSAKLDALVEMLTEVIAEGHRALVFSQFTSYLRLAQKRLIAEGIETAYLDGRTRDRESVIDSFRTGAAPVFLISLKAGGFGLTLTEADYVFVLDPWWNPAAEAQAVDRTHRIGQDKPVNVYRLVSENTIEEKVVALQQRKRDLFARVVGSDDADFTKPLTADDIRGLLEP